jgi:kinetochore protein Nuf2
MSQVRKQPSIQNLPNAAMTLGFPPMTAQEIHDCLYALGIGSTHEDITKPTASFVQYIYGSCLEVLLASPLSVLDSPRNALLGMMEYKVCDYVTGRLVADGE